MGHKQKQQQETLAHLNQTLRALRADVVRQASGGLIAGLKPGQSDRRTECIHRQTDPNTKKKDAHAHQTGFVSIVLEPPTGHGTARFYCC